MVLMASSMLRGAVNEMSGIDIVINWRDNCSSSQAKSKEKRKEKRRKGERRGEEKRGERKERRKEEFAHI